MGYALFKIIPQAAYLFVGQKAGQAVGPLEGGLLYYRDGWLMKNMAGYRH
jgi:hypothetical protein